MINIDLTTKNTVYNTLGPQAQWIQHRFGRRDYPDVDLDFACIKDVINKTTDTINFVSVFGDPSEHKDIVKILSLIPAGKIVFNSNLNFVNNKLIEVLNEKHAYIVFPCYGINQLVDKITLNSNWKIIENNLANLHCTVCVEFYLFEHNISQIELVKELCNRLSLELKFKPGVATHPDGFSTIIDNNGIWLYDAYSCNDQMQEPKWSNLYQTVPGYNSLIQYIKPVQGNSILEKQNFYKIKSKLEKNNVSISVTGNVFPSFELHQIFSNALCSDWDFSFSKITHFNRITIKPEYKYLCGSLTQICAMLEFNSLTKNDYDDILANFADSNV